LIDDAKIKEATQVLIELGLPRGQQNDRSALSLLALLDLPPDKSWRQAGSPLIGITPIMDWVKLHYGKSYKPNTRETFRRQTMHQFVEAGIALYNPDKASRPVNSPQAVYQISPTALALIKSFGSSRWRGRLRKYRGSVKSLTAKYANEREMEFVPVQLRSGMKIRLSPGEHSALIRAIIEEFAPRFAPGSILVYAGDTGKKAGYLDRERLRDLGIAVDEHGKMPDVVLHDVERNWLLLIESVTSHGPVDGKRHSELMKLFAGASCGLVYVTAFPTRAAMARYLPDIAWESEVWVSDAPSHLIHFNGDRFLGPYRTD
jgi:BsuBI/PstI restriction endonuclease domain/BsuBI/PstI restriction endonuclease HTH domain